MDWDFTENIAFKALYDAFKESEETSALEFLSSDGASYYLELTQDAAGEDLIWVMMKQWKNFRKKLLNILKKLKI